MHVPLIIKYPYMRKTGRETKRVTLSDLYPTILSVCGINPPENISGQHVDNRSSPVLGEFYSYETGTHRVLYEGSLKYMRYGKNKDDALYNLESDPFEKNNLITRKSGKSATLQERLEKLVGRVRPKKKELPATIQTVPEDVKEGLKALGYIE